MKNWPQQMPDCGKELWGQRSCNPCCSVTFCGNSCGGVPLCSWLLCSPWHGYYVRFWLRHGPLCLVSSSGHCRSCATDALILEPGSTLMRDMAKAEEEASTTAGFLGREMVYPVPGMIQYCIVHKHSVGATLRCGLCGGVCSTLTVFSLVQNSSDIKRFVVCAFLKHLQGSTESSLLYGRCRA